MAASRQCLTAKLGLLEIQVDVLTGDVMAVTVGAVGPSPDASQVLIVDIAGC